MFNANPQDCEFDIERIDVFSIEYENTTARCIVGYFHNGKIQEWTFECRIDKYQEFLERFRKKLRKDK